MLEKAMPAARMPALQETVEESRNVTPANASEYRARWIHRHGPVIEVPKFGPADHEYIDPMSELAEMRHPSTIIPVRV